MKIHFLKPFQGRGYDAPVRKYFAKLLLFICFFSPLAPLWAGTELKAYVECYADKQAWVNLRVSISDDHLKIHFNGPWCLGALVYDRETSEITVMDDIKKTVFTLTHDNQAALKFMANLASGKLIAGIAGSTPSAKKTYAMVTENARSFFNGVPVLKEKGDSKGNFTCDLYETDIDGVKAREVWVTSPEDAGIGGEDLDTFRSLVHLMVDLCGDELSQLGADTTTFQQVLSSSALPVYANLYAKGKRSCNFQMLGVRTRTFDPNDFVPPANYRVLTLLDMIK